MREHAPLVLTAQTANLDQLEWTPPIYQTFGRSLGPRIVDRAGLKTLGYRPTLRWQLWRHNARLMHAHFGQKGYGLLSLAEACDVPLVTTFYGYDLSLLPKQEPEWKDRYRSLFERGARFLVEGTHMKEQLVELGCPPEKVTVHHLGVDVDEIPYRTRERTSGAPLHILAAGRFVEKKGFPDAIRAFGRFLERGCTGKLTIIGGLPDDEREHDARENLQEVIREQGVENHVSLPGFLPHDELIRAYHDHHVFLAPSIEATNGDNEGGAPVTLIEASATGMAIVATRHCDIPEVVRHEETGLLADEGDVDALSEHLHRLYHNPELLEEMGEAGHKHVDRQYNAKKQGRRLDELYSSIHS